MNNVFSVMPLKSMTKSGLPCRDSTIKKNQWNLKQGITPPQNYQSLETTYNKDEEVEVQKAKMSTEILQPETLEAKLPLLMGDATIEQLPKVIDVDTKVNPDYKSARILYEKS